MKWEENCIIFFKVSSPFLCLSECCTKQSLKVSRGNACNSVFIFFVDALDILKRSCSECGVHVREQKKKADMKSGDGSGWLITVL
jgi:hypothetical protein